MKKLIYIVSIVVLLASCKTEEVKDYVTFSGTIVNQNSDSLVIKSADYSKKIMVNTDGYFSDTLKIVSGYFRLFDGTEVSTLYLKNGFDLVLSMDTKEFDESIKYTGVGAEYNNYLAARALKRENVFEDGTLFTVDQVGFDSKMSEIRNNFTTLLNTTQNLDTAFVNAELKDLDGFADYISKNYIEKQYVSTALAAGNPSPKFINYENFKGGTTSLDDLKGKYVYVDVWATWCGPCKQEIPFLKEIEKEYHGKNIEFVSISIDKAKDNGAWKAMVTEKELGGIQLFADNDWQSDFAKEYRINSIPRFLLIDPAGNVVSADAPRPSQNELKDLLNSLSL